MIEYRSQLMSLVPFSRTVGVTFVFKQLLTSLLTFSLSVSTKACLSETNSFVLLIRAVCTELNWPRPAEYRQAMRQALLANIQTLKTPDTVDGAKYRIPVL